MKYIKLDQYGAAWMFLDCCINIDKSDIDRIKPLVKDDANKIWRKYINSEDKQISPAGCNSFFITDDVLEPFGKWVDEWNSDDPEIPGMLSKMISWDDDDLVYFIWYKNDVIETTWQVFKRAWKNFLFGDEFPVLICPRHEEFGIVFAQSGEIFKYLIN